MKKIIIITGGMATGKSFITEHLASLGYPILRSDDIVSSITSSEEFLSEISLKCGLTRIIDIADLKKAIEQDPEILSVMEEILYPKICTIRDKWLDEKFNENLIPILEIPLFFEKNIGLTLDRYKLITISTICNEKTQISRAKKRNKKMTDQMIKLLISKQTTNDERVAKSTFVIYTDSRKSVVKKQLNKILSLIPWII